MCGSVLGMKVFEYPYIAGEWAANLDAEGESGSEMLNAYLAKLKDACFEGARDWTSAAMTN